MAGNEMVGRAEVLAVLGAMQAVLGSFRCDVCSKIQINAVTATCKHTVCLNCSLGKEKNSLCPLCNAHIAFNEDAFIAGRDVAVNLEKTCGTVHQDRKQSQDSELSCGPLDVKGRSPKKTVLLEAASNDIPQVDLDDDSSSRLVPPLLGDNHKDSIGSKPNDLPQEDLLESLGNQRNTCEDVEIVENRASSQAPVTEDASESNLFSGPVEVKATRNGDNAEDAVKTTKLQFVCSSLPKELVAQVKKLANIVKAEFSSKFTSDTSHLIVRVDESNRADKTLQYLCAVAAGKWVVSPAWVEKCLEAKKLLPEEPFEALDTTGESGPQLSRESRLSKKNLFSGFEFCCIGEFPNISRAQMQDLLNDCGASIVSKPTDFSFEERVIPVALAQWDESKEAEYENWLGDCRAPLVHYEWVLDCIGKFSVTSFSAMLLSDVSEDYYVSMGIPSFLFELTESQQ